MNDQLTLSDKRRKAANERWKRTTPEQKAAQLKKRDEGRDRWIKEAQMAMKGEKGNGNALP